MISGLIERYIFIAFLGFIDLIMLLCYIFPHFSMHAFRDKIMGVNNDYLTGVCRHTDKEIREYKERRRVSLQVSLVITGIVIIAYVGYFIYQKMKI